jgi:hypothetical protein
MLARCANPVCSATFRYFHEGRLFVFETKPDAPLRGPPADPDYLGKLHTPEYFWLCSSCCSAMTVRRDGDQAVLVHKEEMPRNPYMMQDCTLAVLKLPPV